MTSEFAELDEEHVEPLDDEYGVKDYLKQSPSGVFLFQKHCFGSDEKMLKMVSLTKTSHLSKMFDFNILSILHHFMLEDAIQENNFKSEDEGLLHMISYVQKQCSCRCHEEQQEDQPEEKTY